MEVKKAQPPIIDLIATVLPVSENSTYSFGDTIYNPSGKELSPDLIHHEEVHAKQQGNKPIEWWSRYLSDPAFRLQQELEAYGEQYLFAKENIDRAADEAAKEDKVLKINTAKLKRWALESMALALSGKEYGNIVSYGEAESKIRNYSKVGR